MSVTPQGWPFFAPSSDGAVAEALELAGLRPGEHLVDLGCGDGQVLLAAAQQGALVTGIECDRNLVATARRALADAGLGARGRAVVADLFDDEARSVVASADVLFSYLSPAMLQRLTPTLRGVPGARLVTVDFDVPDLVPDERRGKARLYRLPGRRRRGRPRHVGWAAGGTLCVMPTQVQSLTCLEAIHCGGPVDVRVTGRLARHVAAVPGTDETVRGRPVAVDLRWNEREAGTLAQGEVHVGGLPAHPVIVLFSDEDQGQWDLSTDGRRALSFRLRQRSRARPRTTEELLAAANG